MTRSSDQFPFAMTLDELMSALRPIPLKGDKLVPPYNHADELDRLRAHSEALASLRNVNPFGQTFVPPFPDNYGTSLAIPHDQLMASLQPAQQMGEKLVPLSDHAVGLDRMRARQETLASFGAANPFGRAFESQADAFSSLSKNYDAHAPISPDRLWAGMQPAALSLAGSTPTNAPGQVPQTTKAPRALSQMRTDPAWQKEMKQREGGFIPRVYDPTRKGDYTIGFGHHIASQVELSSYRGRAISQNEGEALFQHDLAAAEDAVRRHIIQPLTQNQFDALADFVFQAGQGNFTKSDIYTYTNLGDYPAAQRAFPNTNAATKGASNRRVVEAKKFGAP
jgi:GH24 family phage-related lysozyme (muramidase)